MGNVPIQKRAAQELWATQGFVFNTGSTALIELGAYGTFTYKGGFQKMANIFEKAGLPVPKGTSTALNDFEFDIDCNKAVDVSAKVKVEYPSVVDIDAAYEYKMTKKEGFKLHILTGEQIEVEADALNKALQEAVKKGVLKMDDLKGMYIISGYWRMTKGTVITKLDSDSSHGATLTLGFTIPQAAALSPEASVKTLASSSSSIKASHSVVPPGERRPGARFYLWKKKGVQLATTFKAPDGSTVTHVDGFVRTNDLTDTEVESASAAFFSDA